MLDLCFVNKICFVPSVSQVAHARAHTNCWASITRYWELSQYMSYILHSHSFNNASLPKGSPSCDTITSIIWKGSRSTTSLTSGSGHGSILNQFVTKSLLPFLLYIFTHIVIAMVHRAVQITKCGSSLNSLQHLWSKVSLQCSVYTCHTEQSSVQHVTIMYSAVF